MPEPMVWHDEADRLIVWGTLDPVDACMCRECLLTLPATSVGVGTEAGDE